MTDRALIDGLSREDPAAVDFLYERYWPEIHRSLTQKGLGKQDAEDIFEVALISELRQRKNQPLHLVSATYQTYFKKICNNLYLNYHRKHRRLAAVTPEELTLPGEEGTIERALDSITYRQIIDSAFDTLDEPCRDILTRKLIKDNSTAEIATALGISQDATRQRASRCNRKLREIIRADPRYREMKS